MHPPKLRQSASQMPPDILQLLASQLVETGVGAGAGAGAFSFANDSFSIAASIILFPLIIDVVQITIFLRPAEQLDMIFNPIAGKLHGSCERTYLLPALR